MLQNREERMQVLVSISIVVLFICSNTPSALLIVWRARKFDGHHGYQVTPCKKNQYVVIMLISIKSIGIEMF